MANFAHVGDHLDYTFLAIAAPGKLVETAGRIGLVNPKPDGDDWAIGDVGAVTIGCVVDIAKGAISFADGGLVGYDVATDTAVATTTGDFDCGRCVGGAATGAATVRVLLS